MKILAPIATCSLMLNLAIADQAAVPECPPVTMQCCSDIFKPHDITYQVYGEFLYMQPMGTNLYYGAEAVGIDSSLPSPANVANPYWTILKINPSYQVGFDVGVGIVLNESNIDIIANWERLYGQDSQSFTASLANGVMVGPFFDIGPNSASYKIASGEITSDFDEVNLLFGRKVCFFNNLFTRFYAGATYARIAETFSNTYSNIASTIYRVIESTSTFNGGGPQIGLDYDYRIYKGIFFTGKSDLSLAMGTVGSATNYQSVSFHSPAGLPQPNLQSTTVPSSVQLVPGFEQKLGFSYLGIWNPIKALLEIGYRCQVYLNAIQTVDMASQVVPTLLINTPDVGVFAQGFQQTNSNYMLSGLYVSAAMEF